MDLARALPYLLCTLCTFTHMPRHTQTSTLQEVGQNLNAALSLVSVADKAAETLGADPEARQNLKKNLFFGALAIGFIIWVTKK